MPGECVRSRVETQVEAQLRARRRLGAGRAQVGGRSRAMAPRPEFYPILVEDVPRAGRRRRRNPAAFCPIVRSRPTLLILTAFLLLFALAKLRGIICLAAHRSSAQRPPKHKAQNLFSHAQSPPQGLRFVIFPTAPPGGNPPRR